MQSESRRIAAQMWRRVEGKIEFNLSEAKNKEEFNLKKAKRNPTRILRTRTKGKSGEEVVKFRFGASNWRNLKKLFFSFFHIRKKSILSASRKAHGESGQMRVNYSSVKLQKGLKRDFDTYTQGIFSLRFYRLTHIRCGNKMEANWSVCNSREDDATALN